MTLRALLVVVALIPSSAVGQQNFSCSYGDRGACLGFGETVCSSRGICVDENSACFDRYQCDFQGFTCRSNVTDCIEDNERLLDDYNELVRDYNALLDDHQALTIEHDRNLRLTRELRNDLEAVESCLLYASTLDQARFCSP